MGRGPDFDDALRELYATAPDDFLAKRGELAKRLRANGDADAAADIAQRRKPTAAAWIVNTLIRHDSSAQQRITDLGDRLRAAQHALAADKLRDLSAQRRALVAELIAAAFRLAGRSDPPAGLRDEVHSTLDGAVADPDIASRLGILQRAEQFAGFGFGDATSPQLTLVRGGKTDDIDDETGTGPGTEPRESTKKKPKPAPAQRRKQERALRAARDDLAGAESAVKDAERAETAARSGLRDAEAALTAAKKAVDAAKQELDRSRTALKEAKADRRESRTALDRLERQT